MTAGAKGAAVRAKPARLDDLPESARTWVFGASRELRVSESVKLLAAVDGFLAGWKAHGVPLRAARDWRYGRFLVVAVDPGATAPTGCSIDALVAVLKEVERETDVRFLGNETVWYRNAGGSVRSAPRAEFKSMARQGRVTPASVVFDNSITELAALRDGRWEGPARDSWHATFFR